MATNEIHDAPLATAQQVIDYMGLVSTDFSDDSAERDPTTWLDVPVGHDFSMDNFPLGIFSLRAEPASPDRRRVGTALGNYVIDLGRLSSLRAFQDVTGLGADAERVLQQPTLNAVAALGRDRHAMLRRGLRAMMAKTAGGDSLLFLQDDAPLQRACIFKETDVCMHLPMHIGDYTDFYAGVHHARNIGSLFRDPANALPYCYDSLPIAYHGRSSSVVVSGTMLRRPRGQIRVSRERDGRDGHDGDEGPKPKARYGPTEKLDMEIELGCLVGRPSELGQPVAVDAARDHIFGYVIVNDWSARDLQSYEYVPLGPFTSKNFMTTVSPWVVLADALEPSQVPLALAPADPLPYLREHPPTVFDARLDATLSTPEMRAAGRPPVTFTSVQTTSLAWSFAQMIAHHTVSGCPLRTGDLLASGTISQASDRACGSLMEITRNGTKPVDGIDGIDGCQDFLPDGAIVSIACKSGVGFGKCVGMVQPCLPLSGVAVP